ncbi:glycerol-3-phosphate dehydrogenase [NAD(P)+]-like [Zophobas morio]|uniref:glycerol-3-phosphate dehydrogenase [NAD(P)+]-like n=1 Tax=Zophobas morio TaxID=2755281 RepID=UPI0030836BED
MMSYCGTCKNITVLGAGAFGTAMAVVAARNNHKVILLCRYQDQADYINNHNVNPIVFQEYTLSPLIKATSSVNEALAHPDLVIHAIPVQQSFSFLKEISNLLPKSAPVLSTSKGIHVETELLMCGILDEVLDENHPTAFLSGPSFAKEVIAGSPTTVVIGSKQSQTAVFISELLSNQYFRAYVTDDVIGLEIGGALKNPLAIGAGIIEGLGHGANSLVAFIIRGCFEMKKLGVV